MTPEEAKNQAYSDAVKGGEEQVAVFLKKQFKNLGIIYGDLEPPKDDNEYRRMAKELIDGRAFNAPKKDGTLMEISLDDLDKKDDDLKLGIKAAHGVGSLDDLVPKRGQLKAMAGAIGDGVVEETGSIGFLQGATVMNALVGLIQWVMNGFKGGFAGLKDSIAQVSADRMEDSVGNRLEQLRATRPDMAHILTDENIAGITQKVHGSVLAQASGTAPQAQDALKDVKFDTPDSNFVTETANKVRREVLYPSNDVPLADKIADAMIAEKRSTIKGNWFSLWKGVTENTLRESAAKIAPRIADAVSATVTDPDFRTENGKKLSELDRNTYAAVVAKEVEKALLKHEKEFGLHKPLTEVGDDGKTSLSKFSDGVRAGIAENYDKLAMASRAVDAASKNPNATVASAARDAVHPDLQGAKMAYANSDNKAAPSVPNERTGGGRDIRA